MSKLTERYVQNNALNYLKSYYEAQNPNTTVYARTEVATVYKNRQGRADGLLAFRKNGGRIYTVSLEAKSHKTFNSLKNIALDNRLLAMLSLSFILIASVTWIMLGAMSFWVKTIITLIVSLGLSIGVNILLLEQQHFDTNEIIEQVMRYPADEKWIAVSIDAFNACNQFQREMLISKAQSKGVGVIVVSSNNKIDVKLKAKIPKRTTSKSKIHYYKIKGRIVNYLNHE